MTSRSEPWVLAMVATALMACLVGCGGGRASSPKAVYGGAADSAMPGAQNYGQPMEEASADVDREMVATSSAPAPEPAAMPMPAAPPPPVRAEYRSAQREAPAKKEGSGAGPAVVNQPSAGQSTPSTPESRADVPTIAEPLLVYTATLHLAVFETEKALATAERLARDAGGYLVRRDDRTITIRVPARKFQAVLEGVGKIGDVLHREITVEDVTDQFYDMSIRLKNLRAVRDRFEKLLQEAKTVDEALRVQRELERVTGEIESMEGRLKYLRELIAFSTITLELAPRRTENVNPRVHLPFPWLDTLGLGTLLSL